MALKTSLAVLLVLGMTLFPATSVKAQTECPAVAAAGPGVQRIAGQGSYSFYGIPAVIVDQPVIAMIDDGLAAQGDRDTFPPNEGQVIGVITSDFFTSPFSFTINLPATGSGTQVDLDQDGGKDTGVQVYHVALAQNVLNTVPLVGIGQGAILDSYYRDNKTNEIIRGTLVVYAPDDQQGFPCGFGADGKLFTADDPIATLPPGFTMANIDKGTITFDRSQVAPVAIFDSPGSATLDFSDQGIVESFNTLVDFLRKRYVFNEFNHIDWDALYASYLPRVKTAEANQNLGEYYIALVDLAHDLADAHVYVNFGNILADSKAKQVIIQEVARVGGGVGAELVELNDGRIIVSSVKAGDPAAAVGFTFGTEIVSVDGLPVEEALAQPVRSLTFPGTAESRRIEKAQFLLKWPANTTFEVAYKQPGATEVMTTTLTAVPDVPAEPDVPLMPMEYRLMDGVGYVRWSAFGRTGIATHIFADFVKVMNQRQIPGIIIDVRGNGGGSALMEYAVLSYLFGEAKPLRFSIADSYAYNELTSKFIRKPQTLELSNPPAARPYAGDIVVLVNQHCVSACEFMSYWLQASGRATIVGQYATEGGGGNTNAVYLPGHIQFNYTAGTNLDNKTNKPTFQGVGVQPDIRVPVTEETEQLKQTGGDPVLDAGIQHLRRLAFERLDLQPTQFVSGTVKSVAPTSWTPNAAGDEVASPDKRMTLSITAWTATDETDPDTIMVSTHPGVQKISEAETEAGAWSIYGVEDDGKFSVFGVRVIENQPYIVEIKTTDENLVALMAEFIFVPALRAFEVVK